MMQHENQVKSYDEMAGVSKAAVLLLALDQEAASLILKQLDSKSVEEVTRELAGIGHIPANLRDQVIEGFPMRSCCSSSH